MVTWAEADALVVNTWERQAKCTLSDGGGKFCMTIAIRWSDTTGQTSR